MCWSDVAIEHVSWIIYTRRRELRTRRRKLSCLKQVLLMLVHLRKNEKFAQVGPRFGVPEATAWRYVDETLEVLVSWAPGLHGALVGLGKGDFVIVDGAPIPTHRIAADQPYRSQKHKQHGMNVQVVARPDGAPLWFSRATSGRTHLLTAARAHGTVKPASPGRSWSSPTGLPGCPRHLPHPLLPPPRTARALPAVQPRPCLTAGSGRTRLRATEVLVAVTASPISNSMYRRRGPSYPHTHDLRLFRMKEGH